MLGPKTVESRLVEELARSQLGVCCKLTALDPQKRVSKILATIEYIRYAMCPMGRSHFYYICLILGWQRELRISKFKVSGFNRQTQCAQNQYTLSVREGV